MPDKHTNNASHRYVSSPPDLLLHVKNVPYHLHKETIAKRSAKVTELVKKNAIEDLGWILRDLKADPETFQIIVRFCYGYEIQLSSDNIVQVIYIAYYLEMNEDHSPGNLLGKASMFLEQKVLPHWNETVKALCASEKTLSQVVDFGLIGAFLDSLVEKAVNDPRLLGDPIRINSNSETEEDEYRSNTRSQLPVLEWRSEDLIMVPQGLYEPLIRAMNTRKVPSEYLVSSICKYAKKWVLDGISREKRALTHERASWRNAIEMVEKLLPQERGAVPCTLLFEMLKHSILLEANASCRSGFESRISKELDKATSKDLMLLSSRDDEESEYDVEIVTRVLKNFYNNYGSDSDSFVFVRVAKLVDEFLAEVARDDGLRIQTFVSLAELSVATSLNILRYSDGLYRAIDIFLETHKNLMESERLAVCKVLNCEKLSPEACEHAAKNERLPLRIVVQVLFISQLHIRDTVDRELKGWGEKSKEMGDDDEDDDDDDEEGVRFSGDVDGDEEMSNKLMVVERESEEMKREIDRDCVVHGEKKRSKKTSVWRELKRKFGCMNSVDACTCQLPKMDPKKKVKKNKIRH